MPEDVDYLLSVSRASAAADRQTDMDGRTPSHIILYRAASTAYGSAVKWAWHVTPTTPSLVFGRLSFKG